MKPTRLTAAAFASFLLPILALPEGSVAQEKPVHLFILSGQSNMAGMDPKTGFEPEAKALFPDGEVITIKVAAGGRPIRLWLAEWDAIATKGGLDPAKSRATDKEQGRHFYDQIMAQAGAILEKHPRPATVTFCWMQGERDAKEKLDGIYGEALRQLIENLRRDLKRPDLNFVIGRLSDFGKPDDAPWQNVRKAQVALAEADPRGAWVDCDDLNNKEKDGVVRDDLHYTKEGYELLGRRFARQARALADGKPGDASGRPE